MTKSEVFKILSDCSESELQKEQIVKEVMAKPRWCNFKVQKKMTELWSPALEFMDAKVKDDMVFIRQVAMYNPEVLKHASDRVQEDPVTVFVALTKQSVKDAEEWQRQTPL